MPRIAFRPLVLIAILALMAVIVGAQAPTPQPEDQETARECGRSGRTESTLAIRTSMTSICRSSGADNFINHGWIPQKYHFLKSDVVEFRKEAKTPRRPDPRRATSTSPGRSSSRFLARCFEQFKTRAQELLDQKFDFTQDESMNDDPEKIDFPADKAEADARLRKKVKLDLLISKVVEDLNQTDSVNKWKIRYKDRNRMLHQFDSSELLEYYLSSLTETFDPHSSYLNCKRISGRPAQPVLPSRLEEDRRVASVRGWVRDRPWRSCPGMATEQDGQLQPEDKIVGIRKENGEEVDLVEKKLNDVVRLSAARGGRRSASSSSPTGTKDRRIYEL